jgi:hypothetical protein
VKVQDVITYDQKIVKKIYDKDVASYFYDQDYGLLLRILRTGPKTIKEIEEAYRAEGNEKSDKTLYRYIKTLSEAGLAVEAGKRIYTDEENRNKSVSIYIRTAKVFFDATREKEKDYPEKMQKVFKAYKILLDLLQDNKQFTQECIEGILKKVLEEGEEQAVELIDKADDEIFELLEAYDFTGINQMILNLAWLIMIYKSDFKKKLMNCDE